MIKISLIYTTASLAIIQGITEFLPISSSAHLALFPEIAGTHDQGTLIDASIHLGTLFAVLIYFFTDFKNMIKGFLKPKKYSREAKLSYNILIAFIPTAIAGALLLHFEIIDIFRNKYIIASTTIIFGILLYLADHLSKQKELLHNISFKHSFFIGLTQILALIPGVSRSGITMTAGLYKGYTKEAAVKFSLLLSFPTIAAAGLASLYEITNSGNTLMLNTALISAFFSFIASYIALKIFMQLVKSKNISFIYFMIYRLILGTALFIF
jgi:undecaprenyl-diphosphatase